MAFACDTSRWRRTPEGYEAHRRFWQQLIVFLAHQENLDDEVWVKPDLRRLAAGDKLGFSVGLKTKEGKKLEPARFQVKVFSKKNPKAPILASTARESARPNEERGVFWKTDEAGEYWLEAEALDKNGKTITKQPARASFLVYEDDLEYRRPAADPDSLAKIAVKSDGKPHSGTEDEFARYLEELRYKPMPQGNPRPDTWPDWRRNPPSPAWTDQVETLTDSGVLYIFLLFVTLVCLEWVLRRRWGLV
jgi:hypothetical protein